MMLQADVAVLPGFQAGINKEIGRKHTWFKYNDTRLLVVFIMAAAECRRQENSGRRFLSNTILVSVVDRLSSFGIGATLRIGQWSSVKRLSPGT